MKIIITESKRRTIILNWLDKNYGNMFKGSDDEYYIKVNGLYDKILLGSKIGWFYIVNEELQNSLIDMFGFTKSELLSIFKPWMEGKFDVKVTEVAYTTYHCNTCGKYHPVKYHIEE